VRQIDGYAGYSFPGGNRTDAQHSTWKLELNADGREGYALISTLISFYLPRYKSIDIQIQFCDILLVILLDICSGFGWSGSPLRAAAA
jgi:hypothetical protein